MARSTATRGRGRAGARGRGRGEMTQSRGPQRPPRARQARFEMSRTEDVEDGDFNEPQDSDIGSIEVHEPEDESGSDDEVVMRNSYSALLQSLNARQTPSEPFHKRRKLNNERSEGFLQTNVPESMDQQSGSEEVQFAKREIENTLEDAEAEEQVTSSDEEVESAPDDDTATTDPFQQHFSNVDEDVLAAGITEVENKRIQAHKMTITETSVTISNYTSWPAHERGLRDVSTKKRLSASAAALAEKLVKPELHIASSVLGYRDVLCGTRSLRNAGRFRDLTALHALSHVFKTRDRVIKNNAKLSQQADTDTDTLDLQDQGFTRPKVLVILPTRNVCVKFVESIVRQSQPEQQENKSRFTAGFADQDGNNWEDKPEDFQDLFSGNDDDMFRLGLKFTRKTIKYFSAFYNSDIILASPLGLMRAIEGTSDKDEKKKHDADFLSSIEIVIIDQANALLMQNWQHVEYIFSQLNLLPKESHGCDFSRVRKWYLDGYAKYLRQTIIVSDYLSPEINALASRHLLNVAGRAKYIPLYPGAMLELSPTLPSSISQTFTRFHSPSPLIDTDARFTHFTSAILPSLLQSRQKQAALIYLPTYTDFVRLRNYLSTSIETSSLSFGTISEYTPVRDVARARSHFLSGRHSVLLYTERAHHFRRYNIRGVKKVLFYGITENALFWSEIVAFLGLNDVDDQIGRGAVRAIFSKWDVIKLERIVGTSRVGRLLSDKDGDTFEFT